MEEKNKINIGIDRFERPKIIIPWNDKIQVISGLINILYKLKDCNTGGLCHTVVSDGNIEDTDLKSVINECEKKENFTRIDVDISKLICELLLQLSYEQRVTLILLMNVYHYTNLDESSWDDLIIYYYSFEIQKAIRKKLKDHENKSFSYKKASQVPVEDPKKELYDRLDGSIEISNDGGILFEDDLNNMAKELISIDYRNSRDFDDVINTLVKYVKLDDNNKSLIYSIIRDDKSDTVDIEERCDDSHSDLDQTNSDINKAEVHSSIFNDDLEKVYLVKFIEYSGALQDTVSCTDSNGKYHYLHVGNKPFLVRESDLSYFNKFGEGYYSIDFVGMITKDNNKS